MSSHRELFTPISIGTMEVRNRIAMAPMATDYANGDGSVSQRLIDYLAFHMTAMLALLRLSRSGDLVVAKTDPPLLAVSALPVARLRGAGLVNWLQDMFPEVAAESGLLPGSGLVTGRYLCGSTTYPESSARGAAPPHAADLRRRS